MRLKLQDPSPAWVPARALNLIFIIVLRGLPEASVTLLKPQSAPGHINTEHSEAETDSFFCRNFT